MSVESSVFAQSGVSRTLATFASALRYEQIPADVIDHVGYLILDAAGCCLQGSSLSWTRHVRDLVLDEAGPAQASIIGTTHRVGLSQAVLVNATAGHAFEMDDIHRDSIIHAGSIVLPIVLGIAEQRGEIDGARFIESIVAGYEIGTRVGSAASQSLLLKGFHPQGTTGTFAAGAAAAHALGLNAEQTLHTIGTAASQAAGLMAAQEGAMVKRFHSGRAAQSGVYAALLAEKGFTGIEDVIEADYGGYLGVFSDSPAPERLLEGLGERFETQAVGYKPFAAVTSIHTALEALASIMSDHSLTATDIASIHAHISEPTYKHCAWPYTAQSVTAAQMNLYYGLAVMAIDGAAFVAQYDAARINDPEICKLIEKISAISDPKINALGAAARHNATIVVTTVDGERHECTVTDRKGSPQNPLTQDEIRAKFQSNATTCLSEGDANTLADRLLALNQHSTHTDVVEIIDLLRGRDA